MKRSDSLHRRTVLETVRSFTTAVALGLGGCSEINDRKPPDETPAPDGTTGGYRPTTEPQSPTETTVADYQAVPVPSVAEIPDGGDGENFELVGHNPLLDEHQYDGESLGIPRGSNGDVTIAGDCVYVGSFVGHQPPLIVDVSDPTDPEVVGPVPKAVPGVGNGVEGIVANGDVLVIAQRQPLGGLGFEGPNGLPERGLAVYDISTPREPELVARHDYGELDTHALSLWRDPEDPARLLGVQTFTARPHVEVIDLTGCPDGDCAPEVVAAWDLESQISVQPPPHEAIMSTDGARIYAAQYGAGVAVVDSSNLMDALRHGRTCDPSPPGSMPGDEHCLTAADPDLEASMRAQPDLDGEWHHTPLKVPDRPYLLVAAESGGVGWNDDTNTVQKGTCPGAKLRLFAIDDDGRRVDPDPVGTFGVLEQDNANCAGGEWRSNAVSDPAWLSPHFPLAFPDLAFSTYYSAGFRAIDISDPANPVEVGRFFNEPVEEVRWASYGLRGEKEYGDGGELLRRSVPRMHMFAFSYPVIYEGYVIYADVHSGLYVLDYTGPHADQIPDSGICHPANPGAVEPGYEPCPPYGETDYGAR